MAEGPLNGRVAIVTGASAGIGAAIAETLAHAGAKVVLAARRLDRIEAIGQALEESGCEALAVRSDVTSMEDMKALAAATVAQFGGIDILVNNAGAIPFGNIEMVDETTWRNAWDLKVLGYVNLVRAVYPAMVARKAGVIVNILGTAGERPTPSYLAGSMGNASLMAMTVALGGESVGKGVRVVGVNPGLI
ncbi:MAG TPA: SDR family NAD(P)-dependent oxidoreductase, partial [Gemmatimonadetes bacterium]|nr:SDR family NAD(P)-dependent oxidoreductase [Gemmatimonadota bacterium]